MRKKGVGFLWVLLLIGLLGAAFYFWRQNSTTQQNREDKAAPPPVSAQADPAAPAETAQPAEPAIRYPIPPSGTDKDRAESLPKLEESDPAVEKEIAELLGDNPLLSLLRNQNIVRHIVVTVDNLPRKVVAQRLLPVKPVEGRFVTEKASGGVAISENNFKRYTPFVTMFDKVDANKLVAVYTELYPLFQTAYRDLGYPDAYFNDRLVDVIDHMLASPEPAGPILVRQPHILYRYADPELENSSAGHKIMIRIGKDNAQKVKEKLRQIREILTKPQPQ